ncbi:MAG TPA: FAD-dependent oxidoreductase [Paenibacillus sp.]|uniref:NAD(P)/FAD-dependent oxidoreductase n=1 Tax=Paenibacillus sp. TaxID=58172 RepID=UPI002CCE41B2|nr:FAD-dependent oxidoreductase [Paenibacillus sp.]HUC92171.1 FAD-dependent oxidoreductase [Paenibacillus sp.]
MTDKGMVIVGAGEAGARAAVELRNQGWDGPITLIGEERQAPYERPPLSKQQLLAPDEPLPVFILNDDLLARHGIRLLAGSPVALIDRAAHEAVLADGSRVPYRKLLLTTGARPRKMSLDGSDLPQVMYLRTYRDALALRSRLQAGKRVVIIGGGFIGLEVAASARERGCSVTVIEVAPRILMRGVPEEIAHIVEVRHRAAGVRMACGTGIGSIEFDGSEHVIRLADGTVIRCDAIVAGIGAVPETALAEACGLALENGIRVDERLATSDPDIFAAGDCCSFPHPLYGGRRIRLEAWRNAQEQGMHAAGSMLGAVEPFSVIPWFWSDQYELTLQVVGLPDSGEVTVSRDLGEAGKLFFHLTGDGRLVSTSGIGPSGGIAKDIRFAEMLIERHAVPSPEDLERPNVKLKSLLPA